MTFVNSKTSLDLNDDPVLPTEVAVQTHSWMTRARAYPIFSRTWYRYRARAGFALFSLVVLAYSLIAIFATKNFRIAIIEGVIVFTILFLTLMLGPGMAVHICKKNYEEKKEKKLLWAAIVTGIAISWGAYWGIEKLTMNILALRMPSVQLQVDEKHAHATPEELKARAKKAAIETQLALEDRNYLVSPPEEVSNAFKLVAKSVNYFFGGLLYAYVGGVFHLIGYFRQKQRFRELSRQREVEAAQQAQREAELRLSVLAAQVEPHFLFNTLAGVRSAIQSDQARAILMVDHLVSFLRATIPKMRSDGQTQQSRLKTQLDAVRAYLGLMQARMTRLSFTVESEVEDASFPTLTLITLVENAIKHGIEPKIGAAHIGVRAKCVEIDGVQVLEVSVEDDGVGFGKSHSGSGIGLQNIIERLESMYGKSGQLSLRARPEGGVSATIRIPYQV